MTLDELRLDISKEQKKGIPFIAASINFTAVAGAVCLIEICFLLVLIYEVKKL